MKKVFAFSLLSAALLGWPAASLAQMAGDPVLANEIEAVSVDAGDEYVAGDADECFGCCGCGGGWLDGTYVWIGGDTYKSIGERLTNINGGVGSLTGSIGAVVGANTSIGIGATGLRGQIGASYGTYDPRGRIQLVPNQNTAEEQLYVTAGVYKRGEMVECCDPISYGVVVDQFWTDEWGINANDFDLMQFGGIFGYALNECTEVGVWGTFDLNNDRAAVTVAGAPGVLTAIRAMDQINLYVKRHFECGGEVTFYVGCVDEADIGDWQVGLGGEAPLSCCLGLYAHMNYVSPHSSAGPNGSGEEQWDAAVGLVYYFGGNAASPSVTGHGNVPLLPVANNGSFLITD